VFRRVLAACLFGVLACATAAAEAGGDRGGRVAPDQLALLAPVPSPEQPTVLSGWMDTAPRALAMLALADRAIARREKIVFIESPGGLSAFGWEIAERFRNAGIRVRCIGWCASTATQILLGSAGCIVSRKGRIVLHAPEIFLKNLSPRDFAWMNKLSLDHWRSRMQTVGVPPDLLDRVLRSPKGIVELGDYDMQRVGCRLE
jgi:hypothetical protein